ncbi:MAG: hypothetical protein RLZZ26_159 [Candidatus Parcubacteria bacterium]|jgi:hypothetical protein
MHIPKALFAVLAFAGLFLPSFAFAATLSMLPAYGSVSVGQTITVNVLVSSNDQAMNASSGVVSFPADKLQVVSISKANSIASLWVQDPSFSNSAGTVNFEGVVLNPGFTGSGAKMLGITFRAISGGTANVTYSTGSVLANDGQGTELLTSSAGANIAIQAYVPPPPHVSPVVVPVAPVVVSTTSIATSTTPAQQVPTITTPASGLTILWFPISSSLLATSWLVLNYLSVFLLIGIIALVAFFVGTYAWRFLRRWWLILVGRRGDQYGDELLAIQKKLREEIVLLGLARARGELGREKQRLLERLEKVCDELKEIASWWGV